MKSPDKLLETRKHLMTKLAFQGKISDTDQLESEIQEKGFEYDKFVSDGFDGVTIATLVIDFAQAIAPPAAAVLAAKVATKKQIQVKINGIEVNANSEEETLKLLNELSEGESREE